MAIEQKPNNNYLTLVFKYTNPTSTRYTDITNFVSKMLSAAKSYDGNKTSSEATFDLFGVYVDPEDIGIEEQNNINKKERGSFEANN